MRSRIAQKAAMACVFTVLGMSLFVPSSFARTLDPKDPVQISNHTSGTVDDLALDLNGDRLAWVYQGSNSGDIYMAQLQFVFDADGNLTGIAPLAGSDVLQATPGGTSPSLLARHPILNADGTVLTLQSNQNLPGGSNGDGSPEVFFATVQTGGLVAPASFTQTTNDPSSAIAPALAPPNPQGHLSSASTTADGLMIVFSSTRDWVPGQNPNGIEQIFLFDKEGGTSGQYYQLTRTQTAGRHNLHPVIDATGFIVSYLSNDNPSSVYHVYAVLVPEKVVVLTCEGTITDHDGIPGNECDSPVCAGDPRCPVEVCDDPAKVDEDGNGLANCDDPACVDHPACVIPNAPPKLTIVDSANNPVSAVTVDENQEVRLTVRVEDPDFDFVQIRAYYDDGGLKPLSTVLAHLKYVSSGCSPEAGEDCSCSATIETADCQLTGPLVATFSWKPDTTRGGSSSQNYQFAFRANDSDPTSAETAQTVTVTVRNVNHAPTVSPKPLGDKVVKQGQTITLAVSGGDSDKDTLTTRADALPSGAQWVETSNTAGAVHGEIRWTPGPSDVSDTPHPVSISVSDGTASASTSGTIKVVSNRPPSISIAGVGVTVANIRNPDGTEKTQVNIYEGKAFRLEVKGSDPDGDIVTLNINSASMPSGSVYLAGTGVFSWLPGFDVSPSDASPMTVPVVFTATDGVVQVTKTAEIIVHNAIENDAVFAAINVYITTTPGGNVQIVATVRNTGRATWNSPDYALTPDTTAAGLGVPASIPLSSGDNIVPGATKTFTVSFAAPTKTGYYATRFKMSKQDAKFGTPSQSVTIRVQ